VLDRSATLKYCAPWNPISLCLRLRVVSACAKEETSVSEAQKILFLPYYVVMHDSDTVFRYLRFDFRKGRVLLMSKLNEIGY